MEHIATGYKTTNNFSFVVMSMMAYLSQVLLIWKLCEDISLNTHTHLSRTYRNIYHPVPYEKLAFESNPHEENLCSPSET